MLYDEAERLAIEIINKYIQKNLKYDFLYSLALQENASLELWNEIEKNINDIYMKPQQENAQQLLETALKLQETEDAQQEAEDIQAVIDEKSQQEAIKEKINKLQVELEQINAQPTIKELSDSILNKESILLQLHREKAAHSYLYQKENATLHADYEASLSPKYRAARDKASKKVKSLGQIYSFIHRYPIQHHISPVLEYYRELENLTQKEINLLETSLATEKAALKKLTDHKNLVETELGKLKSFSSEKEQNRANNESDRQTRYKKEGIERLTPKNKEKLNDAIFSKNLKLRGELSSITEALSKNKSQLLYQQVIKAALQEDSPLSQQLIKRIEKSKELSQPIQKILRDLEYRIGRFYQHHSQEAVHTANELLLELKEINNLYIQKLSHEDVDIEKAGKEFISACRIAVNKAETVLKNDLGWGDYLINLMKDLANAIIAPVSTGPNFFTLKKSLSMSNIEQAENDLIKLNW